MPQLLASVDFWFKLMEWCNRNGASDEIEIRLLFDLINLHYYPKVRVTTEVEIPPNNYRALREAKGLTARAVCEELKIKESFYSLIERNLRRPSDLMASKLNLFYET